jgi:hypothetical protein
MQLSGCARSPRVIDSQVGLRLSTAGPGPLRIGLQDHDQARLGYVTICTRTQAPVCGIPGDRRPGSRHPRIRARAMRLTRCSQCRFVDVTQQIDADLLVFEAQTD